MADQRPKGSGPSFGFSVQEVSEKDLTMTRALAWGGRAGGDGEDPGDRRWELGAAGAILLLLPLVIALQQYTLWLGGQTLDDAPQRVKVSEVVEDPGAAALTVRSKLAVKLDYLERSKQAEATHSRRSARRKPPPPPDVGEDAVPSPAEGLAGLDAIAWTRVDRLRVAMVAGELEGPKAALERLDKLGKEAEPGGDLSREIGWLRLLYQKGAAAVPDDAAQSLAARHGWFGRLALSQGKHPSDPARWEVIAGGLSIVEFLVGLFIVLALVNVIGLALCITAGVKWTNGTITAHFEPPAPGGSVYLETFAVFLGGFAFMQLISLLLFGLGVEGTTVALGLQEVLTWGLVVAVFWPRFRGVPWGQWARALGLHRGQGVGREIVCGVLGYLAGQPVLTIGRYLSSAVDVVIHGSDQPEEPIGYGMFEAPAGNSWFAFMLMVMSLVVWAPLVEESIFRGALFRHLRGRMSLVWGVLVTAAAFGIIHPYTTAGLIEVAFMGIVFALLRHWRGSLIAPMVAHALHNGLVSAVSVGVVVMLGE